jgi:tetratricopeptide (TPR) repeat protein
LYGAEGLKFLVDLLLRTGQVVEARVILDRKELRANPDAFGFYILPGKAHADGHRWHYRFYAYDWFDLCECAAAGRYDAAIGALHRVMGHFEREERMSVPVLSSNLIRQIAGEVGLAAPPSQLPSRMLKAYERGERAEQLRHTLFLGVAGGDLASVAGVLELERGDPRRALEYFKAASALYNSRKYAAPALPGEPLGKYYADIIPRHQ